MDPGRPYLLCQLGGLVELVGFREEKPEDPEDEDPLQDQVVRRSLRKTITPSSLHSHPAQSSPELLKGTQALSAWNQRARPVRDQNQSLTD